MEHEEPLEDLIIIHPHLLQKFMRQGKNFANLLALYTFYNYQAKIQKTNQPLATDEFTRKGMNWAMERVRKTKKLLKELNVIVIVQKGYYSYIKLPFIYTKEKVGRLFGEVLKCLKISKSKILTPKKKNKTKPKSPKNGTLSHAERGSQKKLNPKTKPKTDINSETRTTTGGLSLHLNHWIEYCDKNAIRYTKSNLQHWNEKLKNRTSIEQKEALFTAINKKWKNFYISPIKESKYHKFLGKSLMLQRDCDTLIDIDFKDKRYFYYFKNTTFSSEAEPKKVFAKNGYDKKEVKTAPLVGDIKKRILGVVKRF